MQGVATKEGNHILNIFKHNFLVFFKEIEWHRVQWIYRAYGECQDGMGYMLYAPSATLQHKSITKILNDMFSQLFCNLQNNRGTTVQWSFHLFQFSLALWRFWAFGKPWLYWGSNSEPFGSVAIHGKLLEENKFFCFWNLLEHVFFWHGRWTYDETWISWRCNFPIGYTLW